MQAAPILEVRNLTKKYPSHTAVDDLSFAVQPGDVYGFLGENGAGKSTTLRCILGLIHPSSGQVFIKGQSFPQSGRQLLRRIGAVVERPDMYNYLSGKQNIRIFARLCDPKIPEARMDEMLELVGLSGRSNDRVSAYSLGMKQRLGIAIALVHEPDLLILDEPTNGLDPQGIAEIRKLILHLSHDLGKTVLVSSHMLSEVEHIASRLLILHKGRKMIEGTAAELLSPAETHVRIRLAAPLANPIPEMSFAVPEANNSADELVFRMHPEAIPQLVRLLAQNGAQIQSVQSRHSLEELFLSQTSA